MVTTVTQSVCYCLQQATVPVKSLNISPNSMFFLYNLKNIFMHCHFSLHILVVLAYGYNWTNTTHNILYINIIDWFIVYLWIRY